MVEFITLMPFVVPAVVLIFGLLRIYGQPATGADPDTRSC